MSETLAAPQASDAALPETQKAAQAPALEASPSAEAPAASPAVETVGAPGQTKAPPPKEAVAEMLARLNADLAARRPAGGSAGKKPGGKKRDEENDDSRGRKGKESAVEVRIQEPLAQRREALRRTLNSEIEAELEAALAELDPQSTMSKLTELPKGPPTQVGPTDGGKKQGVILSIHGDDVFVDVGGRTQGVLSLEQFSEPPQVGQTVECTIEGFDASNGVLVLSRRGALAQHVDWSTVAEGQIVEAKVTGENKAGLNVEVNGIRGFIPISQLELFRVEDLKPYENQKLTCLVIEADAADKNLILSRRALLEQQRDENKKKLWSELAEGQTRSGVVRNIKEFGAFLDLGGVDGLLPIGELGWARVERVEDVLKLGERIDVVIHRIDHEKQKLTLSRKPLLKSPWEESGDLFAVGHTQTGKVTRLMDFGAFVELKPGVEGLVHISEMATKRINRPGDVVKVGQEVVVQILKVDEATKRIALSMKAVQKAAEEAARAEAQEKADAEQAANEAAEDAKPKKPVVRRTDLKGGIGAGGPMFSFPKK